MISSAQGICFAVATNTVVFVVSEIIRHGRVRRAHIGVAAQTVQLPRRLALVLGSGPRAVRIGGVDAGGPADRPAFKRATYFCRSTETAVTGTDDLTKLLGAERIGRETSVSFLRGGELQRTSLQAVDRGR